MPPPDFPSGIQCYQQDFKNWSWNIEVRELWTCAPASADDVVEVCNWAAGAGYQVRPRAIMHSWSPISVAQGTASDAKIIMIDTTAHLNAMTFVPAAGTTQAAVRVGLGATMEQLLEFLASQDGGQGAAKGFAFTHTPAPGNLTVGGALAINGHGTAIPAPGERVNASYGSLSNLILQLTAVVSDPAAPGQYMLRTFTRDEPEMAALLVHLGRAFLVEATLQVIDNYNLRCQSFMDKTAATLFQDPGDSPYPAGSLGDYVNRTGRVEAIWFPFTSNPWLKVWSQAPTKPESSREVTAPYNYPFSDNLPDFVTDLIKVILGGDRSITPTFGKAMYWITSLGLVQSEALDLWGPSMDTLLYVKDTTLRVTANGYAVQMKKQDVQRGVYEFATKFSSMLADYEARKLYPINSPLEIRITGLDDPKFVQPGTASPTISSLSRDAVALQNGWDVALWLDVLTLPGTPSSEDFYTELEAWMYSNFSGDYARVMPEWSKGWAYSSSGGPWSNKDSLARIRESFTTGRPADETWNWEVDRLAELDKNGLFTNAFLDTLFTRT